MDRNKADYIINLQNKLANAIARETNDLKGKMPKADSDEICALAACFIFANGIGLIKCADMPEERKDIFIKSMHKYVNAIVPQITKIIDQAYKDGVIEKLMSGELINAWEEEDNKSKQASTSKFRHTICYDCWDKKNPDRKANRNCLNDVIESCCFCSKPHTSVLFLREDPENTLCKGEHNDQRN